MREADIIFVRKLQQPSQKMLQLADGWNELRIGDHIHCQVGFPFDSNFFNIAKDGVPLIRIRDLLSSTIDTFYSGPFDENYVVNQGDVLVGMDGDFHVVQWQNKQSALLNQRVLRAIERPNSKIAKLYFYYYSFAILKAIHDKTSATTVKHLSHLDLENTIGAFPPYSEQTRIAEILSTADAAIAQTEALIAKYRCIRTGLLADLLSSGVDEHGRLRNKASHHFVVKDGVEAPEGWTVSRLEEVAEIVDPQPDHRTPPVQNAGVPYLGINDIHPDGNVLLDKCRKVSAKVLAEQNERFTLRQGDIIFGKIGTIGQPKQITTPDGIALSANVILIQPKINPAFIFWYLNSSFADEQVKLAIHATTQAAFGMEKVRSLIILVPSLQEQQKIAARLNALSDYIQSEATHLAKLQSNKRGLMGDLLSGKVRVSQIHLSEPKL